MAYTEVPNSIRVILIILTIGAFIIELHRLYSKKTNTSLSPSYVLCNLIVATEQLTLIFYIMVSVPGAAGGMFTHDPQNTGDWLNFAQITVTWMLFLTLFVFVVIYRPSHSSTRVYTTVYSIYLLISLLPLLLDLMGLTPYLDTTYGNGNGLREGFAAVHGLLFNTLMPVVAFNALFPQAAQIKKVARDPESDNRRIALELAMRSLVFAAVAISWPWRITYPDSSYWSPGWYWDSGWPAVQTGIIAGVQGVLALLAAVNAVTSSRAIALPE